MKGNIWNRTEQKEWQTKPPRRFSVSPTFPLKDMKIVCIQTLDFLASLLSSGHQPLWTTAQLSGLVKAGSPSTWPSPFAGFPSPFISLADILVILNLGHWEYITSLHYEKEAARRAWTRNEKTWAQAFLCHVTLGKSFQAFILTFNFLFLKRGSIIPSLNFLIITILFVSPPPLSLFPCLSSCFSVLWPSNAVNWVNYTPLIMSHCHAHWSRHRPLLFYLFSYFSSTSPTSILCFSPHPTPRSRFYSNVSPLKDIWWSFCALYDRWYTCAFNL